MPVSAFSGGDEFAASILEIDSWADFEALPLSVTDANERIQLKKYLPGVRNDSPRTFSRVASSGVEYCDPHSTWYSLPETMVAGTRFSMPRNNDRALYIYESVAGAKGDNWDATEEARFTVVGEQNNDAGINIVTASGAHYRMEGAEILLTYSVAWFGARDNDELTSGASGESQGLRFDRIRLASIAAEAHKKNLEFPADSYRMRFGRPSGAHTKWTVPAGLFGSGHWYGKGQYRSGSITTTLSFDIDVSLGQENATFAKLDRCVSNSDAGKLTLDGMNITGNSPVTLANVEDWFNFASFSASPTWAEIISHRAGLVGVHSRGSQGVDLTNCAISGFFIGLYDDDQTGHRRRTELTIEQNGIGRAVGFWGGDTNHTSVTITTSGLCDMLLGQQGLVTESHTNCHFGLGGAVASIWGLGTILEEADWWTPADLAAQQAQKLGFREVTFVNSSMEGVTSCDIRLEPGQSCRDLTFLGCVLHSGSESWNGNPLPASVKAWDPDVAVYGSRLGEIISGVSWPNTTFTVDAAKNITVDSVESWEGVDFTGIAQLTITNPQSFNEPRIITPEELEHGSLSQIQANRRPAGLVGGGNLISMGNGDLNEVSEWSGLQSTISKIPLDDAAMPAPFPEEWLDEVGDATCLVVQGTTNRPDIRKNLITPSSQRQYPPDRQLWGSVFVWGDAAGEVFFSAVLNSADPQTITDVFRGVRATPNGWTRMVIPGIQNATANRLDTIQIRGSVSGSVLYVVAPQLRLNGLGQFSRFREPQLIMSASDSSSTKMRLVQPTSTPGPAQWEIYS